MLNSVDKLADKVTYKNNKIKHLKDVKHGPILKTI